jgi:hypothetical protein
VLLPSLNDRAELDLLSRGEQGNPADRVEPPDSTSRAAHLLVPLQLISDVEDVLADGVSTVDADSQSAKSVGNHLAN